MTATVLDAMPEAEYHAHPALSASGAKRLLTTCPATFKYERDNRRAEKRVFDFGHAAHGLVLGVGEPVVVVEAPSWRTKAAQDQQTEAYAAGHVPVLRFEWEAVCQMAEAITAHPTAGALFNPGNGVAEQSYFWRDATQGIDRRARLDWLTTLAGGRACGVDYKTTTSARPRSIGKTVYDFRYYMQDVYYRDALTACGLDDDPAFLFVFQEKTAPYLVTVVELDGDALRLGREHNDAAMQVFAECTANDHWPSYTEGIELISLPAWATKGNA